MRSIRRVCTRVAVDLAQSSTKVKIYYAMVYRFFHPWPAASAINGKEGARERENEGRGGDIREQTTVPQILTH